MNHLSMAAPGPLLEAVLQHLRLGRILAAALLAVAPSLACESEPKPPEDAIVIGAILPFSGEHAAVGINIEQALSLAVQDVNAAGGVDGRPLMLVSRDSNSGSERGYKEAKALLYDDKVKYLIGPEENTLAKKLIRDIKALDVTNLLPGLAAPSIRETGKKGAWIRLAPTPKNVACAMSLNALQDGHRTAVTLVSGDDYLMLMSAAFNNYFESLGGESLGSLTITPGKSSYLDFLDIIDDQGADVVILMAYPPTAAVIAQEWRMSKRKGSWYLAPTLHTDVFLHNLPFGALDGFRVFSSSLSSASECAIEDLSHPERLSCERGNYQRFQEHYADSWNQDVPLSAAQYYYDAVVLLALGLQRAAAGGEAEPEPAALKEHIRQVAEGPGHVVEWTRLKSGLDRLKKGEDIAYAGAAAEYIFDLQGNVNYGETTHRVIDTWIVRDSEFVTFDSVGLACTDVVLY